MRISQSSAIHDLAPSRPSSAVPIGVWRGSEQNLAVRPASGPCCSRRASARGASVPSSNRSTTGGSIPRERYNVSIAASSRFTRRGRRPRTQPPALEIPQRVRARQPITQWIAADIACRDERHERPHRAQIRAPARGTQRLTIQPLLIADQHRRPVRRDDRASPHGTRLVIRTHSATLHAAPRPIIGTKGHLQVPITSIKSPQISDVNDVNECRSETSSRGAMFTLSTTSTTSASSQIARRQRSSPPAARTARLVVYMSTTAILSAGTSFTTRGGLKGNCQNQEDPFSEPRTAVWEGIAFTRPVPAVFGSR